jgi:hypothetical protein
MVVSMHWGTINATGARTIKLSNAMHNRHDVRPGMPEAGLVVEQHALVVRERTVCDLSILPGGASEDAFAAMISVLTRSAKWDGYTVGNETSVEQRINVMKRRIENFRRASTKIVLALPHCLIGKVSVWVEDIRFFQQ